MQLHELNEKVRSRIKVTEKVLSVDDIYDCLYDAVWLYSEKNPFFRIDDKTGNGSDFEWTVPATWEDDWSHIAQVEYPAGKTGERETQILTEQQDYQVIRTATDTFKWRLLGITPAQDDIVRFTYSSRHVVTGGEDGTNTLPGGSSSQSNNPSAAERSVVYAAAYLGCMMAASYYANTVPAGIQADLGDHTARVQAFINMALEYKTLSGLADIIDSSEKGGGEVACVIKQFKTEPSWTGVGGGGYMTHKTNG